MTTMDDCLAGREPPLPWCQEVAAEFAGESPAELYDDPGAIARSLANAADLFDLPAVCTSFDATTLAEAVGCPTETGEDGSRAVTGGVVETVDDAFAVEIDGVEERGRLPAFLDAADRLTGTVDATVLGGIPGPAVLIDQLLASEEPDEALVEEVAFTAGDLVSEVANAFLERGVDGVAVLEPAGLDATDYGDAVGPLVNLLDHYSAVGVVVAESLDGTDVERAARSGFDAVTGRVEDPSLAERDDVVVGVGVPRETFSAGPDAVRAFVDDAPDGALLSSEWTVPAGTQPEAIHELMGSL